MDTDEKIVAIVALRIFADETTLQLRSAFQCNIYLICLNTCFVFLI